MTSGDLRNALLSIADILDKSKPIFGGGTNENIIQVLNSFNDNTLNDLAVIFKVDISQIKNIISLFQSMHDFFMTPQSSNVSQACRNIANSPVLLFTICRFI